MIKSIFKMHRAHETFSHVFTLWCTRGSACSCRWDSFTLSASTAPDPVRPVLHERARVITRLSFILVWFLLDHSGRVRYRRVVNVAVWNERPCNRGSTREDAQRSFRKCRTSPTIRRNLSFFLCLRAIRALAVSSGSCAKEKMLLTLSSDFMSPVFWKSLMSASWLTFSKMLATARLRFAVSNLLPWIEGQTRRDSEYMSVDILRLWCCLAALESPTWPIWAALVAVSRVRSLQRGQALYRATAQVPLTEMTSSALPPQRNAFLFAANYYFASMPLALEMTVIMDESADDTSAQGLSHRGYICNLCSFFSAWTYL